jgi:hypothetical protein
MANMAKFHALTRIDGRPSNQPYAYGEKASDELVFSDVTDMLRNQIRLASGGRIVNEGTSDQAVIGGKLDLAPSHIEEALLMLLSNSPALKERLVEVPRENLEFQKHIIMDRPALNLMTRAMITAPSDSFAEVQKAITYGDISTFSQWVRAIRDVEQKDGYVGKGYGPDMLAVVMMNGFQLAPVTPEIATRDIGAHEMLEFLNVKTFNTFLSGYRDRIVPKLGQVANGWVEYTETSIDLILEFQKQNRLALEGMIDETTKQGGKLTAAGKLAVRQRMIQQSEILKKQILPQIEAGNFRVRPELASKDQSDTVEGEFTVSE